MFDGIKLLVKDIDFETLKSKSTVLFDTDVNLDFGHQVPFKESPNGKWKQFSYEGTYQTYKLQVLQDEVSDYVTKTVLHIRGSLHKNYFDGQNVFDFTFQMLQKEIAALAKGLGIEPDRFIIKNLEIGVNFDPGLKAKPFLDKHLLTYMAKPFIEWRPQGLSNKSIGYECPGSDFDIKIYDKALQHGLAKNILRYEIKYRKMRALNNIGITHLSDLQNKNVVAKCKTLLLQKWDKVYLSEQIIDTSISAAEKQELEKFDNPKTWRGFKTNSDKRLYSKKRSRFSKLKKQYCENKHSEIRKLISEKFDHLISN